MRKLFLILCLLSQVGYGASDSYGASNRRALLTHPIDRMPLVLDDRGHSTDGLAPIEKRDQSVWHYLQSSVRVRNGNVSGSATICYYDPVENMAYLITCGHLFNGNKRPGGKKETCYIEVFYKNLEKLPAPQKFEAEIICYNNDEDIGFMKFKPDWHINHYFAIAPVNYPIQVGQNYESTGCDHAKEVASYTVEIAEGITTGRNLVTKNNSPRPGRSGGALLSKDNYYLAIVWGTSDYSGTGIGYYVPLRRIHAYAKQFPEVSWLLNISHTQNIIPTLPIVDPNNPQRFFHERYIPIP